MTSGFSRNVYFLASERDAQHFNWPPTEAVDCHIKFSEFLTAMRPLMKILLPLLLLLLLLLLAVDT